MADNVFKTTPIVYAVGDEYQVFVPVNVPTVMWVSVNGKNYYDHSNGILRSDVTVHKMTVPMQELDRAGEYTVCYREMIERKPYFSDTSDIFECKFEFKAVKGGKLRAFHISDAHNLVEPPIKSAENYIKRNGELDFLILNGDIPNHSGDIKNFDAVHEIASRITKGNIPVVFSRGNHDTRGIFAEKFADYTPTRNGNSYFSFRLGSLWGLVIDCGEDKRDRNEEYGNTICCEAYRREQAEYIKSVIKSGEHNKDGIERRIVVSHIPFTREREPLFDIEGELYTEWADLLKKEVKPELMICGHEHKLELVMPGEEKDKYGHPCPVLIGAKPTPDDGEKTGFIGCGIEFDNGNIKISFISDTDEVAGEYNI